MESRTYAALLADPQRLEAMIPSGNSWVVVDEVQRIPALLTRIPQLDRGIRRKIRAFPSVAWAYSARAKRVPLAHGTLHKKVCP